MSQFDNNINQNIMWFLTSSATNHEMPADAAKPQSKPLFEYYDSNKDNVLQKEELEKIKQDLQSLISDNDKKCTQKDIKKYLESIAPDKSISINKLNSFIKDILSNYEIYIQNEANGEIELFRQGETGDCWLLSQLSSLSQTSWGKDAIKNSIIKNKNTNSYTVKFAGVNFETTINHEDIQKARNSNKYSDGDLDVLLFEIATEKYIIQEADQGHITGREDSLNGSLSSGPMTMQYLLTGKNGHSFYMQRMSREEHQKFIEKICDVDNVFKDILKRSRQYISNSYDINTMKEFVNKISSYEDCAILCDIPNIAHKNNLKIAMKAQNEKDLSDLADHEYTIKNIKKDAEGNIIDIEIIDPWDSKVPIHMTLKNFLDEIDCITIITKNDRYEDLKTGFMPCIEVE